MLYFCLILFFNLSKSLIKTILCGTLVVNLCLVCIKLLIANNDIHHQLHLRLSFTPGSLVFVHGSNSVNAPEDGRRRQCLEPSEAATTQGEG